LNARKKLSDILRQTADRERLAQLWKETAAAGERGPLPPGEYEFRVLSGELFTSKGGTPGYKLTLEVTAGEYEGRRVWHDLWLTPAALPMTKRDLLKLGVPNLEENLDQLDKPLPPGILLRGKLTLRRDDDGNEANRLVRFECVGVERGDAFEPKGDESDQEGTNEPDPFPFGANGAPPPGAYHEPGSNGATPAGTNGTPPEPEHTRRTPDATGTTGGADQ
jgi:hypothetical protein